MNTVSHPGSKPSFKQMSRLGRTFPSWMRRLRHYGLALLLVAAGASVRWALTRLVGPGLPTYITFYPVVMLAALLGGWGPGLLATVAIALFADYSLLLPPGLFKIESTVDTVGLVFFFGMGLFVSVVAELYRRLRGHLEELVVVRTTALSRANEQLQEEIGERKRAEQAIQQANEQLQQQAEELQTQSEELQTQTEELRDQTEELARANAALGESEEQFRRAIEEAPIPIIMHAEDGQVLRISRTWTALTGYTLTDIPNVDVWLSRAVCGEGAEAVRDCMHGLFQGNRRAIDVEFAVHTRQGRTRHWSFNASSPGMLRDGRRFVVGMAVDITERRRAEEALRELNATLENKVARRTAELEHRARQLQRLTLELSQVEDRERKRMAEILHDDLQQIMAGAKFHLTVLRNRVKYDASAQAIGARIDEMLKDAVAKSRGLSHELSPTVLYHGDLTEALGWLANQVQGKHGLGVHVHMPGPVVVQSEALKGFLYKAAQELLFNVVKHARVSEAGLRVRRYGRYICVSVSDRGRGFDPQGLRQTAGVGLLSIRERIELLGGRMKIKSAPGRGSTFYIVVPDREEPQGRGQKAEDETNAEEGTPFPVLRSPSSVLRVLLADDHRIVREGLRSLLRDEQDVEVVGEATHGREAIDLALRLKPDIVIMDVSMPLIDGDEATRQIKEHLPGTRVIALSTYHEPETIQKMYRAGAESYVLKTASSEKLLAAIRGQGTGPLPERS